MKKIIIGGIILLIMVTFFQIGRYDTMVAKNTSKVIKLPESRYDSDVSVERALHERRSVRTYGERAVTLAEISQLLWAAQGMTHAEGFRTAPSAGALYPLEIYVAVGKADKPDAGIYKYKPHTHELIKTAEGDKRAALCRAALGQSAIKKAPVVLVFCAVYERTTRKYGERGIRYVHIEVGHAAQNVFLQAVSSGLCTVPVGAFDDNDLKKIMNLDANEHPLYIMPVGPANE
ncbi:SagB/ThcOx family dehydrogenase [Desulfonema magnum]|uniref:SagB/ThcOx family dehydrogenase n=1 Tax=Desulfonema magnum TaxID=45655 RepID=UPI001A9B43A4|nr:SagB/ThcOx family dehydrogenase [Desulfonema magnum]